MKRFKISVPLDYISGHLRAGHLEYEVVAETLEEAIKLAMEEEDDGNGDLIVDDYEVNGCGDIEFSDAYIIEYEELEDEVVEFEEEV
jgi:hypothetical protein